MNVFGAYPVIGAALWLLVACANGEELCATGDRLTIERSELKEALMAELANAEVPYQESSTGEVCYPAAKGDFVRQRLIALDLYQRPSGQITIPGDEFGRRAFVQLDRAEIRYTYSKSNGEFILVVEKEDLEEVRAIMFSVAQSIAKGE
jgi:hypothetical protein